MNYYNPYNIILGKDPYESNINKKKLNNQQLKRKKLKQLKEKIKNKKINKIEDDKHKQVLIEDEVNLEKQKNQM